MNLKSVIRTLLLLSMIIPLAGSCIHEETPPPSGVVAKLRYVTKGLRSDMLRIADQTEHLAGTTAAVYARADSIIRSVNTNQYGMTDYGGYYKTFANDRAALWVSGAVPVDDAVRRVAWLTEGIDDELARVVGEFPEVAQAYYNERHSLNRIYPPFDVLAQYEPRMDITAFNFYYLADERHNPGRGPVWVGEPYVDPAGRGWMISSIAPVYVSNRVEGVVGLDITITKLVSRYISASKRNIMLVDQHGVIVAADEYLIDLLELPPLKEHRYMETIKGEQFLPDDYNLLKARTKQVREMAVQILHRKTPTVRFVARGRRFMVASESVEVLRWTAIIFEPLN